MRRLLVFLSTVAVATALAGSSASADVTEPIGDMTASLGWRDEPAFATLPNAVQLTVLDRAGEPVLDPNVDLSVTVGFGDETTVRPLLPREPGVYSADLVPTQPGTYDLHIEGTVNGATVDITSTCSDSTFECVADADEITFPSGATTAEETARASSSTTDSSSSDLFAIGAFALSSIAIVLGVVVVVRTRRPGRST